jgi:hypothetical protein
MTSAEVTHYIEVEGIEKLVKRFEKYFQQVDKWSTQFVEGDLLDENELSYALQQLTGAYQRFHVIASAIDDYKTNQELNFKVKAYRKAEEDGKKATISQIEEEARQSTALLRTHRGNFLAYSDACEKGIISCQAKLKRTSVEMGAKGIDFKGDVNSPAVQERQMPREDIKPPVYDKVKTDVGWNS